MYDDLMDVLEPMLRFIGLHVSRDPVFLAKFLRLGRNHIGTTVSPLDFVTSCLFSNDVSHRSLPIRTRRSRFPQTRHILFVSSGLR